jgi:hypothetical protein
MNKMQPSIKWNTQVDKVIKFTIVQWCLVGIRYYLDRTILKLSHLRTRETSHHPNELNRNNWYLKHLHSCKYLIKYFQTYHVYLLFHSICSIGGLGHPSETFVDEPSCWTYSYYFLECVLGDQRNIFDFH